MYMEILINSSSGVQCFPGICKLQCFPGILNKDENLRVLFYIFITKFPLISNINY